MRCEFEPEITPYTQKTLTQSKSKNPPGLVDFIYAIDSPLKKKVNQSNYHLHAQWRGVVRFERCLAC